MVQYSHDHGSYFWGDEWHPRTQVLEFYGLPMEPSDKQLRDMLRTAYHGYYLPTTPLEEAKVECWVARYRADKQLPSSVVAHYWHERFGAVQALRRA